MYWLFLEYGKKFWLGNIRKFFFDSMVDIIFHCPNSGSLNKTLLDLVTLILLTLNNKENNFLLS